eukprot:scaffold73103_cov32-Tisochrysis_lutea.AAC.2
MSGLQGSSARLKAGARRKTACHGAVRRAEAACPDVAAGACLGAARIPTGWSLGKAPATAAFQSEVSYRGGVQVLPPSSSAPSRAEASPSALASALRHVDGADENSASAADSARWAREAAVAASADGVARSDATAASPSRWRPAAEQRQGQSTLPQTDWRSVEDSAALGSLPCGAVARQQRAGAVRPREPPNEASPRPSASLPEAQAAPARRPPRPRRRTWRPPRATAAARIGIVL